MSAQLRRWTRQYTEGAEPAQGAVPGIARGRFPGPRAGPAVRSGRPSARRRRIPARSHDWWPDKGRATALQGAIPPLSGVALQIGLAAVVPRAPALGERVGLESLTGRGRCFLRARRVLFRQVIPPPFWARANRTGCGPVV